MKLTFYKSNRRKTKIFICTVESSKDLGNTAPYIVNFHIKAKKLGFI